MEYKHMLQCIKSMFQTIKAHAWMNDAHVYEMQVQLCKPNTRGVIERPASDEFMFNMRRGDHLLVNAKVTSEMLMIELCATDLRESQCHVKRRLY